jgi:hypothetical protein
MMMATPTSHPKTLEVFHAAILIGRAVVMHFKNVHSRPRPTQYAADLAPPIDVAGHPSYPSGQATQTYLVAQALSSVASHAGAALNDFADDVAKNRERAGFHYVSDSEAGRTLAPQIYRVMLTSDPYLELEKAARAEW